MLKRMFETQLPLNRKERFYTGTVFPMIVCRDNFKHFHLFLSKLGIAPPREITTENGETNIQFFTEYSLVESIFTEADKQRFKEPPKAKDTPDIVILIKDEKTKILIALEGKMYDVPKEMALNRQMRAQRKILASIMGALQVNENDVYHCALLPEKLAMKMQNLKFPVVKWEDIREAYEPVCRGDYFFDLLCLSLEKYDELVSCGIAFGRNCDEKIRGIDIYNGFNEERLQKVSMGRDGGINGKRLEKDILSGNWRKHLYETSSREPTDINSNWFFIRDFVKLVENK